MGIKTLCGLPWGSERCSRVGIRVCRTCAQGSAGSWLYLHRWHMARKEKVTNYVQHIQKKKKFHCNISVTWTFLLVYRENSSRQHPHFWHWTHGDSKWAQVTRLFPGYGSKWWLEALQTGGIWLASLRSVCLAIYFVITIFSPHLSGKRVLEEGIWETWLLTQRHTSWSYGGWHLQKRGWR